MNNYDESLIEYLPIIGDALSFKTQKQGRRGSLHSLTKNSRPLIKCQETGSYKPQSIGKGDNRSQDKLRLTCINIVKHSKASEKQVFIANTKLAKSFIFPDEAKIIYAIARNLGGY